MTELEIKPTRGMRLRIMGVVLSAMAVAAVIVWLLTGEGVGLFARKADLKTFMPDATGLAIDSPVRLNGIEVGTVKNIAISGYLDKQRAVRVVLRMETSYFPRIPSDSMTSIGSDTLIGDKFVDIGAGKSPTPVVEGGELPSEPAELAADQADLIFGLQDNLHKVDTMMAEIASPDTKVGRLVVGEAEYDQVLRSVAAFEKDMRAVVAPENAGKALFTMDFYNRIDKPLRQIDDTIQAIQRGEGAAGHFYASDEQYNSILSELRDLRKTIAQFRTDMAASGAAQRDEESYDRIRRMLASTDAMLGALNRGEGRAGELLTSPQFYEALAGSLRSIEELLRDVRGNPKKYLRTKLF